MLLISSSWTSLIMTRKTFKMADLLRLYFDLDKVFYVFSSNLLCMLIISSSGTSSIMAEKNLKCRDFLRFFYIDNLTFWAR